MELFIMLQSLLRIYSRKMLSRKDLLAYPPVLLF